MNAHCWIPCRKWRRRILYGIWVGMWCMLLPGSAWGHKVNIFAWVEGDTVHTESKFSGGKQVKGGEVIVYDLEGKRLLSGKTDDRGEFSFTIPERTGMKIVLQAGMGHRGEWTLPASEAGGAPASESEAVLPPPQGSDAPKQETGTSAVSLDQIRAVVSESLDGKLNPVLKRLAEARKPGPSLQDILGGVGYILGLMGIAAYFHFRRKTAELEKRKGD